MAAARFKAARPLPLPLPLLLLLLVPSEELEPVLVAGADDGILIIKLLTAQICGNGGGINDRIRQWLGGLNICKSRTQVRQIYRMAKCGKTGSMSSARS